MMLHVVEIQSLGNDTSYFCIQRHIKRRVSTNRDNSYITLPLLNQMLVIKDKWPDNEMKMFPKHLVMTILTSGPHRETRPPCY